MAKSNEHSRDSLRRHTTEWLSCRPWLLQRPHCFLLLGISDRNHRGGGNILLDCTFHVASYMILGMGKSGVGLRIALIVLLFQAPVLIYFHSPKYANLRGLDSAFGHFSCVVPLTGGTLDWSQHGGCYTSYLLNILREHFLSETMHVMKGTVF